MRRSQLAGIFLIALPLGLGGCSRSMVQGYERADAGEADAAVDAGPLDAGPLDAGPDGGPDAGPFDGGRPDGGRDGGRPDGGGPRDCTGPAYLELGRSVTRPLPVTSTPLAMGCCDGAFLHLHTEDSLGRVLTLMVRGWGGWTEGTFDLEASEGIYELSVTLDNGQIFAPVMGTLTMERDRPGDWSAPAHVTLCGSFELWNETARVWIDRAVVAPWDWNDRFGLYYLRDKSVTAVDAATRPLEDLVLEAAPIISVGSISWYDRSEHAIYPQGSQDPAEFARQMPTVGVGGLPFVVIADGRRIYLGAFWTEVSSLVFRGPTIRQERLNGDAFFIEAAQSGGLDPRGDPRIFTALRESGKLAP